MVTFANLWLRPSTKFEVRRPSRSEDTAHLVCRLSIYNSFSVIRTTIEKNRFYVPPPSFFVCPGDAPVAITQYVAWMERQVNACQTPRSMYLSIFNSFRVLRCLTAAIRVEPLVGGGSVVGPTGQRLRVD